MSERGTSRKMHRADERQRLERALPDELSGVIQRLPGKQLGLLERFYHEHGRGMRASRTGYAWILRRQMIDAALSLEPIAGGWWMRNVLVAPTLRGQGLARALLRRSMQATQGPVWLFCHPSLARLYQSVGFIDAVTLPPELVSRLARYRQSKALIALGRLVPEPHVLTPSVINIAAACLFDARGRVLLVRKRGSRYFMLPGGKKECGETAVQALAGELDEELALTIDTSSLEPLGQFEDVAANEPDCRVHAEVFIGRLHRPAVPRAELDALAWLDIEAPEAALLAPLFERQVMPALRQRCSRYQD